MGDGKVLDCSSPRPGARGWGWYGIFSDTARLATVGRRVLRGPELWGSLRAIFTGVTKPRSRFQKNLSRFQGYSTVDGQFCKVNEAQSASAEGSPNRTTTAPLRDYKENEPRGESCGRGKADADWASFTRRRRYCKGPGGSLRGGWGGREVLGERERTILGESARESARK